MSTLTIKRGDTARKITDVLTLNGSPLNLSGATVEIAWRQKLGSEVVTKTATIVVAGDGSVEYQFVEGDTDVAGDYWLEWHVETASGRITFPSDSKHTLSIVEDLQ